MEIPFSVKAKYGNYNDSLFFPDDAIPSEEEIKTLKEERVRRWASLFSLKRQPDAMPEAQDKERHAEIENRILQRTLGNPWK